MPVPDTYTPNDTLPESRFLRASDHPKGRKWTLVISDVNLEALGDNPRKRLVLSFKDKEKSHVLNATRQTFLEAALGNRPNKWVGASITLVVSEALFQGKKVPSFAIVAASPAVNYSKPSIDSSNEREPGSDDDL